MDELTIPVIALIISIGGLIISLASILYTWNQNRRRIEVNLWTSTENDERMVKLSAFNAGYRSVALLKCELLVNNEIVEIKKWLNYEDGSSRLIKPKTNLKFPYSLKEGAIGIICLDMLQITSILEYNGYSGIVKLVGYFETAQNKIHESKSIDFDIEKAKEHIKKNH
ncbi:hypothetical protein [Methanobacterium sp. MBAC-LM]|uniref:hypothetical protein n=1 Tax=Methanobacterium sp. MBAC-LM TaxID=3412034 RepID=UPI003C79691D